MHVRENKTEFLKLEKWTQILSLENVAYNAHIRKKHFFWASRES